jgi:hypothetical protein
VNATSYAIELYKPYWEDPFPSTDPCNNWQLLIDGIIDYNIPIVWSGSNRFHVIEWTSGGTPINAEFNDVNGPNDVNEPNNPRTIQPADFNFSGGEFMELQRRVPATGSFLTVDYVWVPLPNAGTGWLTPIESNSPQEKVYSYQRDIGQGVNPNKCIRGKPIIAGVGLWSLDFGDMPAPSVGWPNPWIAPQPYIAPYVIQAHPANRPFTSIGDIGQLFRKEAYRDVNIASFEATAEVNLADPAFQQVFKYLTVIDPFDHSADVNETRIKGRININTAPWFVIAQLPWVSYHTPNYDLARAIIDYRDNSGPFKSVGELMRVMDPNMLRSFDYYAHDGNDLLTLPDLTPADGAIDDFEERDVIFARISNLVTVRSDVFTAYILVRIGADGPQKRVVAIFDRSGVTPTGGKVKILAIQQVPDAR